eukprot:scaffold7504_cov121-Isochrysis_galbana.AAC.10
MVPWFMRSSPPAPPISALPHRAPPTQKKKGPARPAARSARPAHLLASRAGHRRHAVAPHLAACSPLASSSTSCFLSLPNAASCCAMAV